MSDTLHKLDSTPFADLREQLGGGLVLPEDPGYDGARAVYNAMIDRHPAAVARCRDAADVVACIRFARAHELDIAVRGGGHNAGGLGVWNGALVIDLSLMRATDVDPQRVPCGSAAAVSGRTSMQRQLPTAWRHRPGSCPPPASAA